MNKWDQKLIRRHASFLQSSLWGDFQSSIGNQAHRLMGDGWTCLVLTKTNRIGRYLFAPYGPILDSSAALKPALEQLTALAKSEGAGWIKIEPILVAGTNESLEKALRASRALKAGRDIEPALTRVVDISAPAEELLATISQSTRSIIRKNQRENIISFKTSTSAEDMKIFSRMLDVVADRRGIGFFPADYFIKQAELLMPAGMMHLHLAYDGKQPVGGAIIHDFGPLSCYTFAASIPEAQKKSVAALTLWQAILNAKQRGQKTIDLYGSVPDDALPSHPWYGLSINKRKFGGRLVETVGTWDVPITRRYRLYRGAQKAQKLRRKLKRS